MDEVFELAKKACEILADKPGNEAMRDLNRFRLFWLVLAAFDLGQASYKKMYRDFYEKYGILMGGAE